MRTMTLPIEYHEDMGYFLTFPSALLDELGWKEGDILNWEDMGDGSYALSKKKETEWVLVETVQQFRHRYMVEVPKGKSEYALDTVVMGEAKEFSQKPLDETIVSHRVISYEDAQALCLDDNEYSNVWTDLKRKEAFFTTIDEYDE